METAHVAISPCRVLVAAGPEIWDELPPEDAEMQGKCVEFPMRPTKQDFGGTLAQFVDSEGGCVSVSGS